MYTIEDSVDESRLKRKLVQYVLFRCPDGYRVYRSELEYRRPKERSRWQRKEAFRSLLPTLGEQDAGEKGQGPVYGLYTEEEDRREYPDLFCAVGMPNVRELD